MNIARLLLIVEWIYAQPEVKADISLAEQYITEAIQKWALEEIPLIPEEAEKIFPLIGRLIRLIIKKIKGVLKMDPNTLNEVGQAAAAIILPEAEIKKEAIVKKLGEEITAQQAKQAAGQPFSQTVIIRDQIWLLIIDSADEWIINLIAKKFGV